MRIEAGAFLSHYRILDRLGEGGTSEVWRALDTRLGRDVALKFLPEIFQADPLQRSRLETEARTVASLHHPHIVVVYSIEEVENCLFMAMEFVQGRTLDRLIPPEGLPAQKFFDFAVPLCDAISAAHEGGVTHRDLKPRNIMVAGNGVVKVLDFGLALGRTFPPGWAPEGASTEEMALSGRIAGTLAYMAPEQLAGKTPDFRSDIFSLGVVLHEMAAGRRPFPGETGAEIIANILKAEPPVLTDLNPKVPPHLSRLVHACLEKNPERRPASARVLCEYLKKLRRSRQALGLRTPPSVAVLPFTDMSPDQAQRCFCDGMVEEILNALSRVEGLRVVSRTSSFHLKCADLDPREIGDRLGVGSLLEGSVRTSGDRIRVAAVLIDVRNGYELWADKYDRELRDVFAIQDEIAQNIVQALKGTLSRRERQAISQAAPPDVRVHEYCLRGREYFRQFRRRGIQCALQMFSRALEIDPSSALAYAGIADCRSYLYNVAERTEENRLKADEASRRAVELNPDLAEAHVARAFALSNSGRHEEAEREFEEAERCNPHLFEAVFHHAQDSFAQGPPEKTLELYRRAIQIRPEDYQSPLQMAWIYERLGRTEEAREARLQGVRLVRERLDAHPDDLRALYMGANALGALGERDQGLELAWRALELEPDEPLVLYGAACAHALAGDTQAALHFLERAIENGFAHRDWIRCDPKLDGLRAEPRFADVMGRTSPWTPSVT